jgi:hypothetical protein
MNDNLNEDPLFSKIREQAERIRYICGSNDSYPTEAWSAAQLSQMLNHAQAAADAIIKATGVTDLEAHYTAVCERASHDPNLQDIDQLFRPYTEV